MTFCLLTLSTLDFHIKLKTAAFNENNTVSLGVGSDINIDDLTSARLKSATVTVTIWGKDFSIPLPNKRINFG